MFTHDHIPNIFIQINGLWVHLLVLFVITTLNSYMERYLFLSVPEYRKENC